VQTATNPEEVVMFVQVIEGQVVDRDRLHQQLDRWNEELRERPDSSARRRAVEAAYFTSEAP